MMKMAMAAALFLTACTVEYDKHSKPDATADAPAIDAAVDAPDKAALCSQRCLAQGPLTTHQFDACMTACLAE